MRKFLFTAFLLFISLGTAATSFAGDHELVEYVKTRWEEVFNKYRPIANSFGSTLYSDDEWIGTNVISYDVPQTQIAFFKDGFILTFLSGENEGKQFVVYQRTIVGVSYPCEKKGRSFKHSYVWGDVSSEYEEVYGHIEDMPFFRALLEESKY